MMRSDGRARRPRGPWPDPRHHRPGRPAARLAAGPITLYYGCDPTADSLHVGNLIGLLVLRRFAATPATGRSPSPAGPPAWSATPAGAPRSATSSTRRRCAPTSRPSRTRSRRILGPDGALGAGRQPRLDRRRSALLDFLREVGKHATVNQMLARESVKARMESEQGISFTEFSYMLLQANDYRWLHEHQGVRAPDRRLGPVGQHPLRRRPDPPQRPAPLVHALCWPLLTAPDGQARQDAPARGSGSSADRTSPYEFFQHWMAPTTARSASTWPSSPCCRSTRSTAVVAAHEAAPERRDGPAPPGRGGHRARPRRRGRRGRGRRRACSSAATSTTLDAATFEVRRRRGPHDRSWRPAPPTARPGRLLVEAGAGGVEERGPPPRPAGRRRVERRGRRTRQATSSAPTTCVHGRCVLLRRGKRQRHVAVLATELTFRWATP